MVQYITAQRTAIPQLSTPAYSSLESASGSESTFTSDEIDDDDENDVFYDGHYIDKGKKVAYPIYIDADDGKEYNSMFDEKKQ